MSSLRALGAAASVLLLASAQPAAACMNAMEEEAGRPDLIWIVLPAVFLVAMLGATIFLVLRFHGGGAESK